MKKVITQKGASIVEKEDVRFPLFFKILIVFAVLVSAYLYVSYLSIGYRNTILEQHGFRQTQTGLTTLYFIKEGYRLDYLTPMYGYPWKVPMEFPVYQMTTAFVYKTFNCVDLDVTGRTVSILYYVLSLVVVYFIIRRLTNNNYTGLIVLPLLLLNPIMIYWSRTFMIESTAVFFNLLYFWIGLEALYKPKIHLYIIGLLIACIAPISKSTTGFLYIYALGVFYLIAFLQDFNKNQFINVLKNYALRGVVFFVFPLLILVSWTKYTDNIKLSSYTSSFWASVDPKMTKWNFGTADQKLSMETWSHINGHEFNGMVIVLLFSLLSIFTSAKYRNSILILVSAGLLGPAVFTNLYYIHDYYSFANTFLFSIAIGILLSYFIVAFRNIIVKGVAYIALVFFVFFLKKTYDNSYLLNFQKNNTDYFKVVGDNLKNHITDDEGFLFFGYIGDPFVPYYAGRKGVCMSGFYVQEAKKDPIRFYRNFDKSNIKAMVVCDVNNQDMNLINKAIEYFKLDPKPVNTDINTMGYYIFLAKK